MIRILNVIAISLFICAYTNVNAQVNLVKNPSFEQYNHCPHLPHEAMYANFWTAIIDTGWNPDISIDSFETPPAGTCLPTYCNACDDSIADPSHFCTVPYSQSYYQYPRTGIGMMYSRMYYDYSTPGFSFGWQQYIQGRLYAPLVAGQSYCVTFYVVLMENTAYAINHLGAYLDDGTMDTTTDCGREQTTHTPQIVETTIINDTLNWVKIQGSFIANGTERLITIGNFYDTAHTAHVRVNPGGDVALYLVDDVSVIASNAHAYAGPDKYAATGDTVTIGLDSNGAGMPCYWYALGGTAAIDSGGTIRVRASGTQTYVVSMDLCGTVTYDTVTVTDTGCAGRPVAAFMYDGVPANASYDTLNFSYTGTGAVDSAHWDFGDGSTGTGFTTTHPYNLPPDSFNVCLTVYGPCGNDTVCEWVHTIVCTVPTASFSVTGTGLLQTFTYTGTSLYVDSVVIYLGDGAHGLGWGTSSYNYSAAGTYTVCVIAYSRCGNDTSCSALLVTTGVSNVTALAGVKVYPNPIGDEVHVDVVTPGVSYQILNMTGECVQQGILAQRNNTLSLKGFAPGVYILEMTGEDEARRMVRLLKE